MYTGVPAPYRVAMTWHQFNRRTGVHTSQVNVQELSGYRNFSLTSAPYYVGSGYVNGWADGNFYIAGKTPCFFETEVDETYISGSQAPEPIAPDDGATSETMVEAPLP